MANARDLLDRKGTKVVTIAPDDTVLEAARRMNAERIGALVVEEPALGVVGIISERDILRRVGAESRPPAETQVSEVMTSKLICCRPDTPAEECRDIMTRQRIRHLPVIENDQLVGIISIGDILAREVAAQQVAIEYMHQYIHGRT